MTFALETVKVVDALLRVKVKVADSPAIRLALLVLNEITGATVSTAMVSVLFESDPSAFKLPAKSVKTLLATVTTPSVLLLIEGVKVEL